MKIRVDKKNIILRTCFCLCTLYVLMRPFLVNYMSEYCKYAFFILVIVGCFVAFWAGKCQKRIGYKELSLLIIFYSYIILNSWLLGGRELLSFALMAYVFYTFPIILMPLIIEKINWKKIFELTAIFGVIDASISIIEFVTRKQMFPMSGVEGEVGIVTKAGVYIVRTYGLQGSYFLLAEVLCFCGLAAFYLFRFEKQKDKMVAWIIISVGILTTGTRGYYVSYAFGLCVMYLCEYKFDKTRKRINFIKIFIAFIICLVALYIILGTNITFGIDNIDLVLSRIRMIFDWTSESATLQRQNIWRWAIEFWQQKFWFGHGACSTDIRYSGYISVTESGILKRLVELGTVGTILQYGTILLPLRKGITKCIHQRIDSIALVFLGTISAYLMEDLILERYTAPEYTILLWTAIAYLAYYKVKRVD